MNRRRRPPAALPPGLTLVRLSCLALLLLQVQVQVARACHFVEVDKKYLW